MHKFTVSYNAKSCNKLDIKMAVDHDFIHLLNILRNIAESQDLDVVLGNSLQEKIQRNDALAMIFSWVHKSCAAAFRSKENELYVFYNTDIFSNKNKKNGNEINANELYLEEISRMLTTKNISTLKNLEFFLNLSIELQRHLKLKKIYPAFQELLEDCNPLIVDKVSTHEDVLSNARLGKKLLKKCKKKEISAFHRSTMPLLYEKN
nr:uncharacterized protein LOC124816767 [Hydra vulgaris]